MSKRQIFSYCDKTETIRLMPSNYLVAHRRDSGWICDPDLAVPERLAVKCFRALLKHENKYGSGLNLLAAITPTDKKCTCAAYGPSECICGAWD